MSISSPVKSQTSQGILCVYPGLGGFYYYSSFEPRVRIIGHCSNPFEEPLCVNSSLGFLKLPVVNIKKIKFCSSGVVFNGIFFFSEVTEGDIANLRLFFPSII